MSRPMIFELGEYECAELEKWQTTHRCQFWDAGKPKLDKHGFSAGGAIGGRVTYQFTATGLGVIVSVLCACGDKANLTDFGSW